MNQKIEYRVRPVERYVVTRYHNETDGPRHSVGSEGKGEFDNAETAFAVAYALCAEEHRSLGWMPGDERIQYPKERTAPEIHAAAQADYEEHQRLHAELAKGNNPFGPAAA